MLAVNASTDLLPEPALWYTSIPHTMVGLFRNGISFTAQGSPPILAQIWIKILLQMLRTFLPLLIVLESTTYDGTGISFINRRLRSSYNGALPFWPGKISTIACTEQLMFSLITFSQSSKRLVLIGNSRGFLTSYPKLSEHLLSVSMNIIAVLRSISV